jgi:glycerol-3-phosphate dehydrogenase
MAADAVDAALGAEAVTRQSATADLPLVGAAARSDLELLAAGLAEQAAIDRSAADRLVARHGVAAAEVVALGSELGLLRPLGSRIEQLEAEVAWAAREELALSIDDVLSRRMRLSMALPDRGAAIAPRVAAILGAELGWDDARQAAEVDTYLSAARIEYGVPE